MDDERWMCGARYGSEAEVHAAFRSYVWLSYRQGFPPLEPYACSSDAGWGCMLRAAQMMLANALRSASLGDEWRVPRSLPARRTHARYVRLLRQFADAPGPACPYSVQNAIAAGLRYDKLPGEWHSPSTAFAALRDLAAAHRRTRGPASGAVRLYVTQGDVVYVDEARRIAGASAAGDGDDAGEGAAAAAATDEGPAGTDTNNAAPDGGGLGDDLNDPLFNPAPAAAATAAAAAAGPDAAAWPYPLLVVVPLRLGLDAHIHPQYVPGLLSVLRYPQSVGFVGGSPLHAIYFVGARGTTLHGLDPHVVQPAANGCAPSFPSDAHLRSVHLDAPATMDAAAIDPSLALGFLCRSDGDLAALSARAAAETHCAVFSVAETTPDYATCGWGEGGDDDDEGGGGEQGVDEEDDFVFV